MRSLNVKTEPVIGAIDQSKLAFGRQASIELKCAEMGGGGERGERREREKEKDRSGMREAISKK